MSSRGTSILVIDDEKFILTAMVRLLGNLGFRVQTADSAQAGLESYARNPTDVVLCDLRLQDGDGLAIQRALKAHPKPPVFILMSGHAQPSHVADAFRNNAADVVLKPFTREDLTNALNRALAARATQPAEPGPEAEVPVTGPRNGVSIVCALQPDRAVNPAEKPALHRITSWPRIVETLRRAVKGRRGCLLLDGSDLRIEVQLSALTSQPGRGYSGAIAIEVARIGSESFENVPWSRGAGCAVWFADAEGVHGFRSTIAGGNRGRLVLAQPDTVVKYCRRRHRRVDLGDLASPRVILPLSDGNTWELDDAVMDLSVGGLGLTLPEHLLPPIGAVLRFGLVLRPGSRLMSVVARVRRRTMVEKRHVCGLEFDDLAPWARVAIQRFVEQMGAREGLPADPLTPLPLGELGRADLHLNSEPQPDPAGPFRAAQR